MALFGEFRHMMEGEGQSFPTRTGWRTASPSPESPNSRRASGAPMLGWSALRDALARAGAELPTTNPDKE